MVKKHLTIITKPTHECNLRCKYCYLENSAEGGKMSEKLLSQMIEKVSNYVEDSHWIWHGGEPLLMGLDFYKEVREIQEFYKRRGNQFSNSIQTNGTLITPKLVDFIREAKDFFLGLSLDGPKFLNDKTRVYADGKGSFDDIILGKEISGCRGAICVVNAQNINYPKELYDFFKTEKIHIKFNPLIQSGRAKNNLDLLGISPKEYGTFLLKLWRIYNQDVEKEGKLTLEINPFIDVIGNLATGHPIGCNYSISCRDSFISIGPKGDIYPCGRFDGIKEFWMGNITKNTLEESFNSEVHTELKKRSLENVTGCGKCNFGKICNSGCMHNAYFSGNIFGKDPYCKSYKMLFENMKEVLDSEPELKGGKNEDK